MPYYPAKKLRESYDAAMADRRPYRFMDNFKAALREGHIKPEELSVKELFEEFVPDGHELIQQWDTRRGGGDYRATMEDASAVSTVAFSNIMGQVLYTKMLETFDKPAFLFDQVCTVVPTTLTTERMREISEVGDKAENVGEGQEFPVVGLSEGWIQTPETIKRGAIVPVTKEAIFHDQTGDILRQCESVSMSVAFRREKIILDALFGITNTYNRNGTTYSTYNASTPWDNIASSNALVDWTDIDAALLTFAAMSDRYTGEPVSFVPSSLIVPSALEATAKRILNAMQIQFGDGASNTTRTIGGTPVNTAYQLLTSPYVSRRTSSDTTWFLGSPKKALYYMQNWPPTVERDSNGSAGFSRQIVEQFICHEKGIPAVVEPMQMVKCTQ